MSDEDRVKLLADGSWIWIQDTTTAMKRLPGGKATFHAMWDGEKVCHYYISADDPSMFGLGMGPDLRSNCITLFSGRSQVAAPYLEVLIASILRRDPQFKGFVSIECALQGGEVIYQDMTIGSTPEFLWLLSALHQKPVDDIFLPSEGSSAPMGFACCLRAFKYPYTPSNNQSIGKIVPVSDLKWDGESYISVGYGAGVKNAWRAALDKLAGLEKYGVIYRRDGELVPRRLLYDLKVGKYI
jgi:hypothetical protein